MLGIPGDPRREPACVVDELGSGNDTAHESEALGLVSIDLPARDDEIEGAPRTDDLREQKADPGIGAGEAGADERGAEPRRVGGDPDVARAREREPTTERRPIHRRDHDLGRLADVNHQVGEELLTSHADGRPRVVPRRGRRPPVAEIQPGTEASTRAGEDRDTARFVGRDLVEGVMQLGNELEGDRVEVFGTVQRQQRHPLVDALADDLLHRQPPSGPVVAQ